MAWTALIAASGALAVASFTLFITAPWLRPELVRVRRALAHCSHETTQLRLRQEIVTAAILRTLPADERFALLADLAERLPPPPPDAVEMGE